MTTNYFEQWLNLANKAQKPLQEMTELNLDFLKNVDTQAIESVMEAKKPQELFDLQLNLAVDNSKKSMDYLKKAMEIVEKSSKTWTEEVKKGKTPT